jgi:ParB/RepB/Spo0J family partition protein
MNENPTEYRLIKIDDIKFDDPTNGRAVLDPTRVAQLADSLAHEPLLHPITLRLLDGRFRLIAGRHRIAAFQKLGREFIPALILECSSTLTATLRLTENLQRTQLSPVEEATQLAALVGLNEQGVEAVASLLARSVDWILDRLEILAWPEALIEHVHKKRITLAPARLLARIKPPDLRDQRIADAAHHGCSTATARLWLQHAYRDDPNSPPPPVFSCQIPQYQQTTEIKALCAGCNELVPIEETELQRWCASCLSTIRAAQRGAREMSPCLTPPVYDPPPPIHA